MKVNVNWKDNVAFDVSTESGHSFIIDGPPAHGGQNQGFRPMEAILAGAASCSAFDVVHILNKKRKPPTHLSVEVQGTRADTDPKVFIVIDLTFTIGGVNEAAANHAVQLSVEKYCSALVMLASACKINYAVKLL